MANSIIIYIFIILLCGIVVLGKPVKTPESEDGARIWAEVFQNKPIVSLEDSRVLVKMPLLSPFGKKTSSARAMGLADIVIGKFGSYSIRDTVTEEDLLNRARELKGEEPSSDEQKKIHNLAKRQELFFFLKHPNSGKFSFLIKDDAYNLHLTVKGEKTMEKALAAIARQNGLCCNYSMRDDLSAKELRLLLTGGNPVLLEEKRTGKWLMAFGMYRENGNDYVFLNDVENTTVISSGPSQNQDERESLYLNVIKSHVATTNYFREENITFTKDIISKVDISLPQFGFLARQYNPTDYYAHVTTFWRKSLCAWDKDLLKFLKCKQETKDNESQANDDSTDRSLWNRCFCDLSRNNGIDSGLVPVVLHKIENATPFSSCLSTSMASQDENVWRWTLTANKMWLAVRSVPDNDLLIPTQNELDSLVALAREKELKFKKCFEEFTGNNYNVISNANSEDRKVSPHDSSRTVEWIIFLIDNASTPEQAVEKYAANSGKRAFLEGGRPFPWEIYQRAILQKIPVLLRYPQKDDWRIAIGFVSDAGRKLLVTVSPLDNCKNEEAQCSIDYGINLPDGVRFEEFDEKAFIPYFIHRCEPDIASCKNKINEIFSNNHDAKKIP